MSCEGQESPRVATIFEDRHNFAAAVQPMGVHQSPRWDCRAASGSQLLLGPSASICAREHAPTADIDTTGELRPTYDGAQSCHGGFEPNETNFDSHSSQFQEHSAAAAGEPHGQAYISILGGASTSSGTYESATPPINSMQNYATATDCILQNLTMVVGNPSVRCFANAPWRAFTWVCALLQETSTQPWGTLQEAVQESIDTAEQVDLQNLPGLRDLWKQHDLNVQGDASHFVNSLWLLSQSRAFHYGYAEIKEGGYLTDHVQQPILVPYLDDWPDDVSLQQLINNWANQGMGQYLMDDKKILICHITRNTCADGVMTKHQKPFNPYGTFTMPRSLDGFARTSTEFAPVVLICHRGQSHQHGHYFAILIYRGLMWLADDGKVPTHLPNLTPSLAGQITQVWAVSMDCFKTPQQVLYGLPPPEVPDYEPPLHPSPMKKARMEQDHNVLHFGNVTNFGRQVLEWYWTRDSGIYIFAETHLDPQRHFETCQYLTVRGRTAFGTPAVANQDNNGTHGGLLVIADPAAGITQFEAYTVKGCGYQSFLWQATETTLLVIGLYMKTGETLQSETNALIMARLLALITHTADPFVCIGDWQNPPNVMAGTVLSSKFHILVFDHSVLSGNTIDYAILHDTLAGTTSLLTEWAENTVKCPTFHHYRKCQTSTSDRGPHTNPKPNRLNSMAIHQTSQHRHGQIGCPKPSSTSCRKTPGRPKDVGTSYKWSSNHLFPKPKPTPGAKDGQLFGNNSRRSCNWQYNSRQTATKAQCRVSCSGQGMHTGFGLGHPHGLSFSTHATIGTDIVILMQHNCFYRRLTINSKKPNKKPMRRHPRSIGNGSKKDTKKV